MTNLLVKFPQENRLKICHQNFTTFFTLKLTRSTEICHLALTLRVQCHVKSRRLVQSQPDKGKLKKHLAGVLAEEGRRAGVLEKVLPVLCSGQRNKNNLCQYTSLFASTPVGLFLGFAPGESICPTFRSHAGTPGLKVENPPRCDQAFC